jgi:type VI secretion system secreted protein VgrG
VTVHKDTTTTVETGDRKVTVSQGGDTLTVSVGDHTITVSAGKSSVTAAQSITLSVGANSIKIDTTGVTINGMMVSMQADTTMSLQGGESMSLTAAQIALN